MPIYVYLLYLYILHFLYTLFLSHHCHCSQAVSFLLTGHQILGQYLPANYFKLVTCTSGNELQIISPSTGFLFCTGFHFQIIPSSLTDSYCNLEVYFFTLSFNTMMIQSSTVFSYTKEFRMSLLAYSIE